MKMKDNKETSNNNLPPQNNSYGKLTNVPGNKLDKDALSQSMVP